MSKYPTIKYSVEKYSKKETIERAESFYNFMNKRRSIRHFSTKPIPEEVVENIIKTASTAPSGANKQPWTFCVVTSKEIKSKIREAAEKEEHENYNGRMSDRWLKDLAHLETDEIKEFLEIAPALIIVFKKAYDKIDGEKHNNYYVTESVGLASGFLLAAIHNAGLASLTHTPSPMNFLCKVLDRPENERPFLLIPVGYPAENCEVPDIKRKPIENIIERY